MWRYGQFTPPVARSLLILIFLEPLLALNFHFSANFVIVLVLIFIYLKHNTISFISSLLYQTLLLHNFPMFFCDSSIKWCWRWSTLNFLGMVTIVFLLLSKSLLYYRSFIMFINFCLYSHCCPTGNNSDILSTASLPACYSNATRNCGLPLLGVHSFFYTPYTTYVSAVYQHGRADVRAKYFPFWGLLL